MNAWKLKQRALKQLERIRRAGKPLEIERQDPLPRVDQLTRRAKQMPLAKLLRWHKRGMATIPGLLNARQRWAASEVGNFLPYPQQAKLDELLARNSAVSRELALRKEVAK